MAERADDGTFLPGVSGNAAGRPKGKRNQLTNLKQDLEIALRQNVKPKKIEQIVEKMCDLAAEGNVGAAKLVLDKVMSNARDAEDVNEGSGGWTFVVKNVTIQPEASPEEDDKIIDVTPQKED